MDGYIYCGWMDDGETNGLTNEWIYTVDGWKDKWIDRLMERQMD